MTKWTKGNRLIDPAWPNRIGTVEEVDDYGEFQVVTVRWDCGGTSDFTPGEETKKIDTPEDQRL